MHPRREQMLQGKVKTASNNRKKDVNRISTPVLHGISCRKGDQKDGQMCVERYIKSNFILQEIGAVLSTSRNT